MNTFQHNLPIFVRDRHNPIIYNGKTFKFQQEIPWQELNIPQKVVETWFAISRVYHNPDLEVKSGVGDRLTEMDSKQLEAVVDKLNIVLKGVAITTKEYNSKRCKKSKIDDKQRGLIRRFLSNNDWILKDFYSIRDEILK